MIFVCVLLAGYIIVISLTASAITMAKQSKKVGLPALNGSSMKVGCTMRIIQNMLIRAFNDLHLFFGKVKRFFFNTQLFFSEGLKLICDSLLKLIKATFESALCDALSLPNYPM
jgi:hypothetical protein